MATITIASRVQATLEFKNKQNSMYLAIGKTSPWTNESIPPDPDPEATALQEIVGYKKVSKVSLCRVYKTGDESQYPTVKYGQKRYTLIPDAKAYQEKAYMVYIESELSDTDLPLGTFRQVGVHTGLVPKTGVKKEALLPNEVSDTGLLVFFDNRQQQNRISNMTLREKFIVTMMGEKQVQG